MVKMTTSEFALILPKVHGQATSLQLSCAWEYSISTNAHEIVQTLGEYQIPNTSVYTNGNLLPDALARAIIHARLGSLVFSIGEARKETYERIRCGGRFEQVLGNVEKVHALREQLGSDRPRLCTNLTLVRSNIGELLQFVDLAHELGIDEIRGRHLILNEPLDMNDEIIQDQAYANSVIESAHRKAAAYGMTFAVPRYSAETLPKPCRAPWNQLYISSNGDVSVCPRIHLYAKIGNLLDQDLSSVIKGAEMANLRKQFDTGEYQNPVCRVCMANRETEIPIDQGF